VMRDIRERKFLELREDAVGRGPDRFGPALLRCLDRCGDRAIGAVAAAARRDLRSAEHELILFEPDCRCRLSSVYG
jgi:hypothetical protein